MLRSLQYVLTQPWERPQGKHQRRRRSRDTCQHRLHTFHRPQKLLLQDIQQHMRRRKCNHQRLYMPLLLPPLNFIYSLHRGYSIPQNIFYAKGFYKFFQGIFIINYSFLGCLRRFHHCAFLCLHGCVFLLQSIYRDEKIL